MCRGLRRLNLQTLYDWTFPSRTHTPEGLHTGFSQLALYVSHLRLRSLVVATCQGVTLSVPTEGVEPPESMTTGLQPVPLPLRIKSA